MRSVVLVMLLLVACGGSPHGSATGRSTLGAIAGLARDHDSGDPVALAEIRVRARGQITATKTTSDLHGIYDLQKLPPGTYQLSALFAGQPIEITNIEVRANETSYVDLTFTLGRPDPITYEYSDKASEIDRYRPRALSDSVSRIEGTVSDAGTRERVPGAVVTAVTTRFDQEQTEQTVSDDQGRYRFEALPPGTYAVSAYYSVDGKVQIEVRRSDIEVKGAEAVVVPLWIELTR